LLGKKLLHLFPRLRAAYHSYRESRLWLKPPVKTPQGFWLVGSSEMQAGHFEPMETALFERLIQEVDVCINVGANVGYYCCLALQHGKQAVAFEPMPTNLRLLMGNMERNGWSEEIEIFPLALSSHIGTVKLYGGGTGASLVRGWAGQATEEWFLVAVSTLDTVLGDRFNQLGCLIWMDVEGAELGVLQGASRLLARTPRPLWMVEIAVAEHQPQGVHQNPNLLKTFELFEQAGYQAFTADQRQRPIELDEIRLIADTGIDTLQTHNFLFR